MLHANATGLHDPRSKVGGATTAGGRVKQLEPLGVPPKDAFQIIGCGVTKGYQLIGNGDLEIYKLGRATRVTVKSIRACVARLLAKTRATRLQRPAPLRRRRSEPCRTK